MTSRSTASRTVIHSVHTARSGDVGTVEIVFLTEREARAYAQDRSTDWRVSSAGVTGFTVGELGTRRPVTWYVDGLEQGVRWDRQLYPTDGSGRR